MLIKYHSYFNYQYGAPAPIAIHSRTLRWEASEFEQWLLSRKSSLIAKTHPGKAFAFNSSIP
jgi:hypothetical protein